MAGLLIHVEGQTEETTVKEVLSKHLIQYGFDYVAATLIGDPRKARGGIVGWDIAKREIVRNLRQSSNHYVTTMVDFYGLPKTGDKRWPGRGEASRLPFPQKATTVENAMMDEIVHEMGGDSFYPNRFIPFVVMHEFEALLFSDCPALSRGIERRDLESSFQAIRDEFGSPEEINDSPNTAPSKRISKLVPGYQKPLFGTLAVIEIGLERIRAECSHFNEWIGKLEGIIAG
jgi:Domain of unknown function (DUF4276)